MSQVVSPEEIETKLERIWDSFQGTNKMRACLFNLIIYTKKGVRTNYLTSIAQKVIERFPSRILFITYDEEALEPNLTTTVSVMTAGDGDNVIACDLIEIAVSKHNHLRVPFILLPHILPDLPVYLVYTDDPLVHNPIAQELEKFASRVIFDSESSTNLLEFARAVTEKKRRKKADVADLNWARTESWRQLFANVFKAPDELLTLRSATHIKIDFNGYRTPSLSQTETQSIYLQGWIACQLGWTLKKVKREQDKLLFSYETETTSVEVSLIPQEMTTIPPGRPLSISIETASGIGYHLSRKKSHPHHIIIEKSTPAACFLPTTFIFEQDVSGKSLVGEICQKGSSNHYLNMLSKLANINIKELNL